jgi:hypothetical protein
MVISAPVGIIVVLVPVLVAMLRPNHGGGQTLATIQKKIFCRKTLHASDNSQTGPLPHTWTMLAACLRSRHVDMNTSGLLAKSSRCCSGM